MKRLLRSIYGFSKGIILFLWSFMRKVSKRLNDYSSLIIAVATIALVLVTWSHIHEARQMREETKRLVDTTILQFKIRSYPSFFISARNVSFDSGEIKQEYKIHNKGEITAFEVTCLLVNGYKRPDGNEEYYNLVQAFYKKGEKTRTSLHYKSKILPGVVFELHSESPLPKNETFDSLSYSLIFVRFKVPYDKVYRYESSAYILKKQSIWHPLSSDDTESLIKVYLKRLLISKKAEDEQVKDFFVNYRPVLGVFREIIEQ